MKVYVTFCAPVVSKCTLRLCHLVLVIRVYGGKRHVMGRAIMKIWLAFLFILSLALTSPASYFSPVTCVQVDWAGGIHMALDCFRADIGRYPSTVEGIASLVQSPTNLVGRWRGPYLEKIPCDPWGSPYVYRCPGIHNTNAYDIYSCGADGRSKTQGNDPDDINNWDHMHPHAGYDLSPGEQGRVLFPWIAAFACGLTVALSAWIRKTGAKTKSSQMMREGIWSVPCFAAGSVLFVPWGSSLLVFVLDLFSPVWQIVWWMICFRLAFSGIRSGSKVGFLAGMVVFCGLGCCLAILFMPVWGGFWIWAMHGFTRPRFSFI